MAPGDTMQGRRLPDYTQGEEMPSFAPGDYCKMTFTEGDGRVEWWASHPKGGLGNLAEHQIEEHEDGTITVNPSILVEAPGQPEKSWHGYLERGVWREG
jgi:hypothetical protein